jgi:hypothetical protein
MGRKKARSAQIDIYNYRNPKIEPAHLLTFGMHARGYYATSHHAHQDPENTVSMKSERRGKNICLVEKLWLL